MTATPAPAPDGQALEARLAAALAAHRVITTFNDARPADMVVVCSCGYYELGSDPDTHRAEVVAAEVERAVGEADDIADWLGDMPESRNVFDITDEATTVISIDVETLAERIRSRVVREGGNR